MKVITLNPGEQVMIGEDVRIVFPRLNRRVCVGVEAPRDVKIEVSKDTHPDAGSKNRKKRS